MERAGGSEHDGKVDGLAGKRGEKISSAGFRREVKFRGGGEFRRGEFRGGEFQEPRGAIGEDDTVPANIAASVAFRDGVIRGWIPRQEPEAQLTVFVGGNRGWGGCADGQAQRSRSGGRW